MGYRGIAASANYKQVNGHWNRINAFACALPNETMSLPPFGIVKTKTTVIWHIIRKTMIKDEVQAPWLEKDDLGNYSLVTENTTWARLAQYLGTFCTGFAGQNAEANVAEELQHPELYSTFVLYKVDPTKMNLEPVSFIMVSEPTNKEHHLYLHFICTHKLTHGQRYGSAMLDYYEYLAKRVKPDLHYIAIDSMNNRDTRNFYLYKKYAYVRLEDEEEPTLDEPGVRTKLRELIPVIKFFSKNQPVLVDAQPGTAVAQAGMNNIGISLAHVPYHVPVATITASHQDEVLDMVYT